MNERVALLIRGDEVIVGVFSSRELAEAQRDEYDYPEDYRVSNYRVQNEITARQRA